LPLLAADAIATGAAAANHCPLPPAPCSFRLSRFVALVTVITIAVAVVVAAAAAAAFVSPPAVAVADAVANTVAITAVAISFAATLS
jgi:hypothetical protein